MIPFENPTRVIGMIAAGTARRIGAMIHDTATGRILAHVQETGLLSSLAGPNPLGLIMGGGKLASSIMANVQLEQVKKMLAGLQMLTAASLAASAVGIGVSVAGFALVMQRLRQLEGQLDGVHQDVLKTRLATERVDVRLAMRDWARTESLLYRGEEAWLRSDAPLVWQQLDGPLAEEQLYWRGLVGGRLGPSIFLDTRFTLEHAAAAYETVLTLASARIQTLLLLGQMEAAHHHAVDFQQWHEQTMFKLLAAEMARARAGQMAREAGLTEDDARSQLLRTSRRFMDGVFDIQSHLAGRPELIQTLMRKNIPGEQYVRELRNRQDMPLLLLPAAVDR